MLKNTQLRKMSHRWTNLLFAFLALLWLAPSISSRQPRENRVDNHIKGVISLLYTPDGKYIVTKSGYDNGLRAWDARTGKRIIIPLEIDCFGFLNRQLKGKYLSFVNLKGHLLLWDFSSQKLTRLKNIKGYLPQIEISKSEKQLVELILNQAKMFGLFA